MTKSKPVESVSHQFLQKCSVSGTPIGKAKQKAGQQLKRSNITTEKYSSAKGAKSYVPDEKQRLYNQCLNAPASVRCLTPKEQEREIAREKLGLMSKDRQREIEILKKGGKKSMGTTDERMIMGTPGFDLISLGLVDAEKIPKYELPVEDVKKLAKDYSRVSMRTNRATQAVESTLLRLKKEAIDTMAEDLKKVALVPDLTPFPANRFMATLTPPIEGYIEKVREATKRSSGNEKMR